VVRERSFVFALRIVRLSKYLRDEKKEFVLSKQVLRSGASIGALCAKLSMARVEPILFTR
jgi:four helix bundle protein